ncbi:MAG: aspartate carbamoyltransferase [Eubacterium sp.]|jgi:aspartate carbamoyltransferase catalytic subunit|nr:aspartate carbamoyltransferase [Eubacterium sp.]
MGQVSYNHLIDLNRYSTNQWNDMLRLAGEIMRNPRIYENSCGGKIMGTMFYEPSTRTQMSFQSAMLRLGGGTIGFVNPSVNSSVAKGENLKDTAKVISGYCDIAVIRHNLEGAALAAAINADCPIINAGDGGHLHPTQTLTDLMTLKEEKGKLSGLSVGVCGDLKHGRTVHSLIKALSCYKNNRFVLISTDSLRIPEYIVKLLEDKCADYIEISSLDEAFLNYDLDVLYMTRIQRERFESQHEYKNQADKFILNVKKMKKAPEKMIVLHPLPRINEIDIEVDSDPRALYFKQANYGMYIRMALILQTINYQLNPDNIPLLTGEHNSGLECRNMKCITRTEVYLPKSFKKESGDFICEYCEEKVKAIPHRSGVQSR